MNHPESEVTPELPAAHAGEACAHAAYAAAPHAFKMPPQEGYQGTPEEIEKQWLEQAYTGRGDTMKQLTWRSTLLGCLLGGVMAVPNLYLGLKSGILTSVSLTCTLMAFILWNSLLKLRLTKGKLTILEYNAMASTASAAGYCTVGVLVSSIAAFILINNATIPIFWLMAWVLLVAVLGVTMAIPMKRQIINVEQLPFPGTIASAETLQLLVDGSKSSMRSARALMVAAVAGGLDSAWAELERIADRLAQFHWIGEGTAKWVGKCSSASLIGTVSGWFSSLFGKAVSGLQGAGLISADAGALVAPEAWTARTVFFAWDMMLFSSGAFMGLRLCATMLVSATLCWAVYAPLMQHAGVIHGNGFGVLIQYSIWGAAACMVVSGLVTVAFQWRALGKALGMLADLFKGGKGPAAPKSAMAAIEAPMWWFLVAQAVAAIGLAVVSERIAHIPWWQTLLAVALSFLLSMVTCRICGETGQSVHSAMSKVTQLTFGAMNPGKVNINLMAAGITTGTACNAADLLSDLKVGYYLGAHPRKQFLAQFFGIFAGVVVSVLVFTALVPNKAALTGKDVYVASFGSGEKQVKWQLPETATGLVLSAKDGTNPSVPMAVAKESWQKENPGVALPEELKSDAQMLTVESKHIAPKFLAPSAWAWKGIAEAVAGGWGSIAPAKRWTMLGGAIVGLLLSLLPKMFPSTARWMPSAGAVGSAWIFSWYMCLLMFLGALATEGWRKLSRKSADELVVPVASGLFVGCSLMAVGINFFTDGKEIVQSLIAAFK